MTSLSELRLWRAKARNGRGSFSIYTRWCRDCTELFKTVHRKGAVCEDCKVKNRPSHELLSASAKKKWTGIHAILGGVGSERI